MSGRQAKRERADARDAYVRQFFLAYIRRLRGILKRLGPTAEPLQDGSCVLARIDPAGGGSAAGAGGREAARRERADGLQLAALDAAVAAAYGWPADITDDDALRELLARNRGS